jgi:hypothetical protein|tara:strand:+ start:46 stop:666 length:621 start_codon:yes stop_codon:yes gene_type:complete
MADANAKLKWAVSMTPVEVLSDAEGNEKLISSSTCYGTVGGSGTVAGVGGSNYATIDDTGDATSGYINGAKQFTSVASAADATGAAFTALAVGGTSTNEEGIWIKNSGFQHNSITSHSDTAIASTTFLVVRAIASQSATTTIASTTELASGDEPIIAVLGSGEGIFLPLRKTMLAEKFSLASSTVAAANGAITASGETIAAEILVF